jgi:hypothetical protein
MLYVSPREECSQVVEQALAADQLVPEAIALGVEVWSFLDDCAH